MSANVCFHAEDDGEYLVTAEKLEACFSVDFCDVASRCGSQVSLFFRDRQQAITFARRLLAAVTLDEALAMPSEKMLGPSDLRAMFAATDLSRDMQEARQNIGGPQSEAAKQPHPLCDYPAEECDHDWGQPDVAEAVCKKCGSSVPF